MSKEHIPNLTYRVELPGGQARLREAVLYISEKSADAQSFGLVKLNKMLWKADFDAFAERRLPITGRQYVRQAQGPVPYEMYPLLQEMQRDDQLVIEKRKVIDYYESRPRALVQPNLRHFSFSDVSYLDRAIEFYWHLDGRGASEHSHGVAWQTRSNGDPMPYELAYLSDKPLAGWLEEKLARTAVERGWRSQ